MRLATGSRALQASSILLRICTLSLLLSTQGMLVALEIGARQVLAESDSLESI